MRLGIFAKTFAGAQPGVVLSAVAAAGYETAQYNMACSGLDAMPEEAPPDAVETIRAAAAKTGVKLVALSGTYNMIHPDPEARALGHRRLDVIAETAARLAIPLVTLCTGSRDPHDQWRAHRDNDAADAWSDLVASMATAVEIAERHGVDLGIEPELANVMNSAKKARRLIDEMGSARLKIVLDPANLFEVAALPEQRRIVAEAVDLLGSRIVMGHAKDRTAAGDFCAAGQGVLDYPHYLGCLARAGFDGPLVTHGLAAADAPGVARFLRQSLASAGIASA
jgi:sugar phosphate isomerase/epimerase